LQGIAHPIDILDEPVEKYGRTSGLTKGEISAFEMEFANVEYPDGSYITLDDQIEIKGFDGRRFARPGDSGALVFSSIGNLAIAMINGGDPFGYSFASPFPDVLDMLGAEIAR
jgi:hypothetical protein